jgi:polysaccharide transporter, PST family
LSNTDTAQYPLKSQVPAETLDSEKVANWFWIKYLPNFMRAWLVDRHNLQAVLANSSWLFMDKVLRLGVGLIVGLWIARYLGPDRFGLLNYSIALTALFSAVATLGLDSIVVRELVKSPENRDQILGSSLALKIIGGLLAFGLTMISVSIMRHGDSLTLWVVGLLASGLVFQSLNVIDLFFQSKVQSRYTVYAANGAFILTSLLRIFLLLSTAPLIAFAWAGICEVVLTSLFLLVAYRARHLSLLAWRLSLSVMRNLLRDSWPLIFSGVSIMISMRIDQVLIGQMLNDKQVGFYSAGTRISEVWYFIPLGIASSVFPIFIKSKEQSEALFDQRLQRYYDASAVFSIAVSLIITVFAGPIVRLLFGPAYIGAIGVLRILIWCGVPMAVGAPWTIRMLVENRTKTMFHFQLFGAALNLILNLLLIPRFGIAGSAYASLISYGAWMIVLCPLMKSQRRDFAMMTKAFFLIWLFNRPQQVKETD